PSLAVIAGLAVLTWSADRFVLGAAGLARTLGVTPLLIGLTVVAFGTSAPEIIISVLASLQGSPGLAVGNAIGSNIANIGLVLGVAALIAPLTVASRVLRRELPVLLVVTLLGLLLLADGVLGVRDGLVLLAGLLLLTFWLVRQGMAQNGEINPLATEVEESLPPGLSLPMALFWLLLGLALLLLSSRTLVWGAVEIAQALGVSELVIGLTIVAIGTSLPELAASVAAALKGENDLAIGNIVGSNLFNLLAVLAIPGILAPAAVENAVLFRDYPLMLGLTVLLFIFALTRGREAGQIQRWQGAMLLGLFAGYLTLLGWSSVS
ncbi:MAG TPA: calcium/sodium antiporter, partial [Thioalkalivibrio sp.]|nr:calcium/sodium antiporter [Thioalkalivibrio sp.]